MMELAISNPCVLRRTLSFTQTDFDQFALISGDNNPIHVDAEFSAGTRFGRPVSHGMLLYTVIWGMIQNRYPGAQQLSQYLMFPAPTFAGEALQFEVVAQAPSDGDQLLLKATATRQKDGVVTCQSETLIQVTGAEPC